MSLKSENWKPGDMLIRVCEHAGYKERRIWIFLGIRKFDGMFETFYIDGDEKTISLTPPFSKEACVNKITPLGYRYFVIEADNGDGDSNDL